jgi:hypothetical protein
MKKTAAALLLVAGPALAGAGVLQDTATAGQTHHTKHYLLKQTADHRIGKYDFAGTDRIMTPGTHDVVGFDAITGHFQPKQNRALIQVAFALKGGLINLRVHNTKVEDRYAGTIVHGTGAYAGISGTVHARDLGHGRTAVTLEYVL